MILLFLVFLFVFFPYANDKRVTRFPFVTAGLIGVNVLFFVLEVWGRQRGYGTSLDTLTFRPGESPGYALLTYAFVHADVFHLFFNLWFLYLIGGQVEERMGRVFFLAFYLAGALSAALAHTIYVYLILPVLGEAGLTTVGLLGASGAIYAVLGAYFILYPFEEFRFWYCFPFFLRAGTIRVATLFFVVYKALGDFVLAYLQLKVVGASAAAHWAHLGGLALGLGIGLAAFGGYAFTGRTPPSREEQARRRLLRQVARRKLYTDAPKLSEDELLMATDDLTPEEAIERGIFFHAGRLLEWGYQELLFANPRACLEPPRQWATIELLRVHGRDSLAEVACWNLIETHPRAPESIQARLELARLLSVLPEMRQEAARLLKEFLAADPALREKTEAQGLLRRMEEKPLWQWKS